jgi:hypothetical protein
MRHVEFKSKVGPDGVLTLTIPVGLSAANCDVNIIVESAEPSAGTDPMNRDQWNRFIASTAGSISDPTFQRYPQGEFEPREEMFS